MDSQQQLDWLREHHALVNFGLHDVTIWCVSYTYVVAETLEEAIGLMMGRMGVVESLLGDAHQPLLLSKPEERIEQYE